jgi:hypothetical protein
VASFGKLIFLFGGIDFTEEIAYNDLYVLNTLTWEWKYIGEAGQEIVSRNAHSLEVLYSSEGETKTPYLVLYGGASPETGPLGDTYYASLPTDWADVLETSEAGESTFYVTWNKLNLAIPGMQQYSPLTTSQKRFLSFSSFNFL